MFKREIVYQFKTYLNHTMQRTNHLEKAREAINLNLVGTKDVNIPDPRDPYRLIPNPAIESHPNAHQLKEAHWLVNASIEFPIVIRIYNDGSRDCVPCEEFEDGDE